MRLVVTADIHAHNFNDFAYITKSGRNNRLEIILGALASMREHCLEVKADAFIIVGDIYESQDKIAVDVLDGVSAELQAFNDEDIKVFLVLGNHDYAIRSAKYHSLRPFQSFAHVIDKPDILDAEDCVLYCLPFTESRIQLVNNLNKFKRETEKEDRYKLFLGHMGLADAYVGPTERRIKSPIMSAKIHPECYDLCLLGHYHKPQQITHNMFYIGSPAQNDWGEREDEKVFFDIDTEKKTYDVIPLDTPRFKLLTAEEFEELEDKEKDFIKVQPSSKEELETLSKGAGKNVQVLPLASEELEEEAPKVKIVPGSSMRENIVTYVESFEFEPADEKELINLGSEIFDSVQG